MEQNQADQLIFLHSAKLQPAYVQSIREQLINADFNTASVAFANLKDPTIVLIVSILAGSLGIDRFWLGDTGIGIGKLVTTFLCGIGIIWWIVDLFLIMDAARQKNTEQVMQTLAFHF